MSKREVLAGATDQTIDIFVNDSSLTTGGGLTGLVFNSAGLTCYYRKGATGSATALTLATLATIGTAHADGGFKEVDATNMPGVYRLDLSDTIVAAAGMVTIYLRGATNMVPCVAEIEVVSVNKFDSVRMGMTALPNAAADGAGGLPISDAGGLDLDAKLANTNEVTAARMGALTDWINGGRLDLILDDILLDTGTTLDGRLPAALTIDGNMKSDALRWAGTAIVATSIPVGTAAGAAGGLFISGSNSGTTTVGALTVTAALTAGSNAVPWNASWDTEVESEVNDALVVHRLDELMNADSDIDGLAPPTVGSVFHELMTKTAGSFTYDQAMDSLEAIRDRGDAAWITATSVTVSDKTGYALTSAERNSIADAYLDRADAIETGLTPRLAHRYVASAAAGKVSGAGTGTETFKAAVEGSTTRLVVTVDSSGNRTGIVYS